MKGRSPLAESKINSQKMLKTKKDNQFWMVTQPGHAQLAGTFAAHWGNHEFRRLGELSSVSNPSRLRSQTVFAIAQHDNGWTEWEAAPRLSEADRLPPDLSEMVRDQQDGMNRWRIGLNRFPDAPFANLLISRHPQLLYEFGKSENPAPVDIHPLFWKERPEALLPASEQVDGFLDELSALQEGWIQTLAAEEETKTWIEPETLRPHARMLQVLDGLSLGFTSSLIPASTGANLGLGQDSYELREVPRTSWDDRVTIHVTPTAGNGVILDPFPFDIDPLVVRVPAKAIDADGPVDESFQARWHSISPQLLEFRIGSSKSVL